MTSKKKDWDKTPEIPKGLTDTDLVTLLRSPNAQDWQTALNALFNDANGSFGAVLIRVDAMRYQMNSTSVCDVHRLFSACLALTSKLGQSLGIELQWVPVAPDPTKLVIAPG